METSKVDNELWDEFHRVVNMPLKILGDWLTIIPSDPDWERFPDPAGMWTGYRVLNILRKNRPELDEEDVRVMRRVVDQVHAEVRDGAKMVPEYGAWLRRLLSIGHDPARAA